MHNEKNYHLGVKDNLRYFDMNTIQSVPIFLSNKYSLKSIITNELRKSSLVWIKYQSSTSKIDNTVKESLVMLTNCYKIHLFLNQFSGGKWFLTVASVNPKKQLDTKAVLKDYIQIKHNFDCIMKGERDLTDDHVAQAFFSKMKKECIRLNAAEGTEEQEKYFEEAIQLDTEQKDSIEEFCSIHTKLIEFEEEYESQKGYDFVYSSFKATEKSDNTKGVSYSFIIDKSMENIDKDSLVGQNILIRKDENDKGIPAIINDVDTETKVFFIKIFKRIGYEEIPQSGYIKKSDKNITFEIQRSAFKSINEGTATNKRVYHNIALSQCIPIKKYNTIKMDKLTESQNMAVNMAMNAEDFLLVQGPPGTGKTEIIVEMVKRFIDQGKRVLISSKNNLAVDNVLEKCIDKELKCIRLGRSEAVKVEKVKSVLIDVYVLTIQKEIEKLAHKYQNSIHEKKNEYTNKLNTLKEIGFKLKQEQDAEKEMKKIKAKLLGFKVLKFFSFVSYFVQKHAELEQRVQKTAEMIKSVRTDINNKAMEIGMQIDLDNKRLRHNELINESCINIEKMIKDLPRKQSISEQWIKELQSRQDVLSEISLDYVPIIGATCIGVNTNKLFKNVEYDVAIIDEAGQIQIHDIIVPMAKAKKAILIGDHKQLPPVADNEFLSKAKEKFEGIEVDLDETYRMSLFEKLFYDVGSENKVMLDTQFRMHADIATPISELFYEGKYKTGCKTEHRGINIGGLKNPIYFIDTCNMSDKFETVNVIDNQNVYTNQTEARIIAKIIVDRIDFLNEGTPIIDYNGKKNCCLSDVGIITPYKAQIQCIKSEIVKALKNVAYIDNAKIKDILEKIEIDTVDSFQGRDKEIIFFSFVRSNQKRKIGFLNELRRLNVTITRAKRMLILVGDCYTLINTDAISPLENDKAPKEYFKAVMEYCKQKGYYQMGFDNGGVL